MAVDGKSLVTHGLKEDVLIFEVNGQNISNDVKVLYNLHESYHLQWKTFFIYFVLIIILYLRLSGVTFNFSIHFV